MKQLLLLCVCVLTFLPAINVHAQADYVLLAPLPGLETTAELNAGEGDAVANYFSTLYKIGVSLALVIAVVMLIYGGIQYMTSDSIGGKSGGRETIGKAIIGIVLAVTSYALLYVIGGVGAVTIGFDVPEGISDVAPPVGGGGGGRTDGSVSVPQETDGGLDGASQTNEPVATQEVDHQEIEMVLLGLTNADGSSADGSSSLSYETTWEEIDTNATLQLELYQVNPESNEFSQLVETISLGELGPDGEGDVERGIIEIDAGILTNPTIARLALYDMDGSLLEDHLYGFEEIPASNEPLEPGEGAEVTTVQTHSLGPQVAQSTALGRGTHVASPGGSGSSCSSASPCSLQTAVNRATAGSVVFLRNGIYPLTTQLSLTTSGTSNNPITFESYPGERAIIDGQNNPGTRVRLGGNYIVLRNLDVTRMESSAGVHVLNGSNNLVDGVHSYNNRFSGFGIYTPYESYPYTQGSNNVIRNCVAYGNSDVGVQGGSNGGDSDGISVSSGDNNKIFNCLVYSNSDDGIDAWRSTNTEIAYNIVHSNGIGGGDGNGVKSGGPAPGYGTFVHHNISYNNRATGVDQNSGKRISFFNNVSWDNNYGYVIGADTVVRNNVSLGNSRANSGTGIASNNTWNGGFSVSSADFESINPSSDFFFVLKSNSNLVNAGVNVELPFNGSAPDIGAVESSY